MFFLSHVHVIACTGTTRLAFAPQLEGFDCEKFTIIAWDPPGLGYSRPPNSRYHEDIFNRDAQLAAKLMTILGVEKYSVMGWSAGGTTGLILTGNNPDIVTKLIVWGAPPYKGFYDKLVAHFVKNPRSIAIPSRLRNEFIKFYGRELYEELWKQSFKAY